MSKESLEAYFDFEDELSVTMEYTSETPVEYFYNKLHEETGEVAEVVSAYLGSEKKYKKISKKSGSLELALLEELADTINVAFIIALKKGFTPSNVLDEARKKMRNKNEKRSGRCQKK